jgi:hypothetical protein
MIGSDWLMAAENLSTITMTALSAFLAMRNQKLWSGLMGFVL